VLPFLVHLYKLFSAKTPMTGIEQLTDIGLVNHQNVNRPTNSDSSLLRQGRGRCQFGRETAFRRFRMDDSYEVAAGCAGAQKGKGNLVKYHRFATHVFGKWNSRRCLIHRKRHTSIESLCWRGEVCLDLLE
jgi:hypothetical protein